MRKGALKYSGIIDTVFPNSFHIIIRPKNDEGEMLWSVDFVMAKMGVDIGVLRRKTWITSKSQKRLEQFLSIYMAYNNGYNLF